MIDLQSVRRLACGILAPALLTGCAHYTPQPLNPVAAMAQLESRRLDDPALGSQIATLLPRSGIRDWPPSAYGPAELLAAALARNAELAQSRARLAAAVADVTSAGALPNPSIGLALQHYLQTQADSAAWLWAISSDFSLAALRDRSLQVALADRGVRSARLDYADRVWQLRHDLRAALQELLIGQRQWTLAQQIVDDSRTLDGAMAQRVTAGEAAPAERQLALHTLLQAQQDAASAAARVNLAEAALARNLGIAPAALRGANIDWPELNSPAVPDAQRLSMLRADALLQRSEIERALNDYDARELELHLQVRAQYPSISLGPGYTYDHGVRNLDFNLNFTLPLLNRNAGPIAAAEARRTAAGAGLEAAQATVLSEIDGAVAAVGASLLNLSAAQQQLGIAEQQRAQLQSEFELGGADQPALLNARLAAALSAQAGLAALDRAQRAVAALEDALRTPLNDAERNLIPSPPTEDKP